MHTRDHLFKKAKSLRDPDVMDEAKSARNLVNDACKQAKNDYIKGKLMENEGNPRKFWSQLKPLCKDVDKKGNGKIELMNDSTDTPYDDNEVPDVFNGFFSGIGLELKQKVSSLNQCEVNDLYARLTPNQPKVRPLFKFRETNELELSILIKNIRYTKPQEYQG